MLPTSLAFAYWYRSPCHGRRLLGKLPSSGFADRNEQHKCRSLVEINHLPTSTPVTGCGDEGQAGIGSRLGRYPAAETTTHTERMQTMGMLCRFELFNLERGV